MTRDEIAEAKDRAYIQGEQNVARKMWRALEPYLPDLTDAEKRLAALLDERQQAVATLREICAEYGDNDWPDDLHLRDVIRKHLGDYLS